MTLPLIRLSNWYIGETESVSEILPVKKIRSRVYQTLFEILKSDFINAPFSPFLTDRFSLSLSGRTTIHLSEFTDIDESAINTELEEVLLRI
ncbi:MAG: hypothetical protein R3A12_10225 [Ignavibacteria bacterium]